MQKAFLFLFLFLFGFSFIHAQDAKKAKDLLDAVSAKIKSYDNINIIFKYTLSNPKENISQENRGNFVLSGDQYVLNFMGFRKIFDGKKIYTINPEDEEVNISKYDAHDDTTITPSKIFSFFNNDYKYSWDILQNIKGKKIQYIKLIPLNTNDSRKEILIGIDMQTKHIYTMIEIGKNESKTILTINSFKTNQPLSKNHFTFTESKYPNYYINYLD